MANPVVIPTSPLDNTSGEKSIHGKYSFTVDDTDSSINTESLSAQGYYSSVDSTSYDFENRVVGNFRDTGANPTKQTSVDIITYTDNRIEMTVVAADGDFNSALYFPIENKNTDGCSISVRLGLSTFSTTAAYTARPYYSDNKFTGVSTGIFDLKTGNAVILFFNHPTEIVVAGPASDGAGTRVTHAITYNWVPETTFSIFIDYKLDKVTVTAATVENGVDTVIYTGSLSALGTCLSTLSMANLYKSDHTNVIGFVSQDGREVGDLAVIRSFEVCPYSYKYISGGSFTKNTAGGLILSRDAHIPSLDTAVNSFSAWSTNRVKLYKSGRADAIEFAAPLSFVKENFVDLDSNTFFLYTKMYTTENVFSGVNSGIGIDILGGKQFSIRYLDGGYIGLRTSNNPADVLTYNGYERYQVDINKNNWFLFRSDGTTFSAWLGRSAGLDPELASFKLMFTATVASLPTSSESCVRLVAEPGSTGVLFTTELLFSATHGPALVAGSNGLTTIPQSTFTYTIKPPSTFSSGAEFKPDSSINSITGSYVRIPKYSPTHSGVTCVIKGSIWGTSTMQPGGNYGPILLLNTATPSSGSVTHSLRLMMTKGNDGMLYLYFPGDPQDSQEVAYQTNKGKFISAPLSKAFGARPFELCLRYIPKSGLYVYNMYQDMFELLLHIPAADIDGSHHLLPNVNGEGVYLPIDVANDNQFVAAVGLLEPSPNIKILLQYFLVGIGRGADVSFFKDPTAIPVDDLYGSKARLLVTAEDND